MGADFEQVEIKGNRLLVLESWVSHISYFKVPQALDILLSTILSQSILDVFVRRFNVHPVGVTGDFACLLSSQLAT